tara:strand:- start:88 stop:258 length:171 start_codon:yes stop_codon:yes gene_type:complete
MTKKDKKTPPMIHKWREAMTELLKDKEIQKILSAEPFCTYPPQPPQESKQNDDKKK